MNSNDNYTSHLCMSKRLYDLKISHPAICHIICINKKGAITMKSNIIDELQDEIYKLRETNRILLFQKDYLEQQLTESETARENCKLLQQETFWERHKHLCDKCKRQEESKIIKELDSTQEKEK